MLQFRRLAVVGWFVVVMGSLVAGCSSSDGPTASRPMSGTMEPGVECSMCRVVYVRSPYTVPGYEGPRVVGYFTEKQTVCPGCEMHATSYFATGTLPDRCKDCGGTMLVARAKEAGPAPK